ncbi:MAG: permease-like cell division protein FtsX [Fibrobacter sp.]|nr:permease-like cell division protein FtsX [Fibrobacter sp.]
MFSQIRYLISEAFRGWKEHHTVVFPSLVTIFLCSVLLGLSLASLLGSYRLSHVEDRLYRVEVFLKNSVSPDSLKNLQNELFQIKQFETVVYKSPDSAMQDFKKHFSDEMLSLVSGNPLPASFVMTLAPRYREPAVLHEVVLSLEKNPSFDAVESPVAFVDRISEWKFSMIFWPIATTVLIFVTLFLIIGNAVRLSLFSRKLLVENIRYAGGSAFFIEFPFLLEGVMQGVFASGIAALLLGFAERSLVKEIPVLEYYLSGYSALLLLVVFAVTLVSVYSSYRSVREFLKRDASEH